MTAVYRGGNSRLLARHLDQLAQPLAVLDPKGTIVFVNAAMCELAQADATVLVGQTCRWQIAADETPNANLLTLLAPPEGARTGRVVARQLTTPPVFGSSIDGQLFHPVLDDDGRVLLTLVQLSSWQQIQQQLPAGPNASPQQRRQEELAIVAVRSRWKTLDGLAGLLGSSAASELAMSRAQLAIRSECHVLICGPVGVGKSTLAEGIFAARLKAAGLPHLAGRHFPIDCAAVDVELLDGMLEVFAGRLRPDFARAAQHLVLENLEQLSEVGVEHLLSWHRHIQPHCLITATAKIDSLDELTKRPKPWPWLLAMLRQLEISLAPLRSRREDVPPLATQLLASHCAESGRAQLRFASRTLDLLSAYPWPKNLLQLRQVVEESAGRAVLTPTIQPEHLPSPIRTFPGSVRAADAGAEPIEMDAVLLDLERIMIRRVLELSPRNRAQAARLLNISRPRLLRRIEQLGLSDSRETQED